MDVNAALQLLLTLTVLSSCSVEGKRKTVCRKSLRRLHKRSSFLDGSVVTPRDEDQDLGCVEYRLNITTTPRPALTLPSRWMYHPQPVVIYLPKGTTQPGQQMWVHPAPGSFNLSQIIHFSHRQGKPQPVVIHGQPLTPVNKLPPGLEAFLRGYRVGQGGVGPGGVRPVVARPVNTIQLPARGISDLLNSLRRNPNVQNGSIKGSSSTGPPFRPPLAFGHVHPPKFPFQGDSKSKS